MQIFIRYFSSTSTLSSRKEINKEIRTRLAAAYRGLDSYGLNEGVCNHLSAIAPSSKIDEDIMLIIPFHLHWSEVTPSNLIEVNNKHEVIEGEGKPETTALCIHQGVYWKRPDVKSVMHTHMPYASTLTCLQKPELLMMHQNSCRFYERIAYDTEYSGLGESFEEGNPMIQVLAWSTRQNLKEMDKNVIELTTKQIHEALPQYARRHLESVIRRLKASKEFL
ncbi:adducin-related protein C1289.14 [Trichonephila inaurata madagascariensis]|uniref:Adducin-related protein C1289.14 n=1 Tax=Trichonephila inaurata madagascariensis TaxID=2747483 RepID=A0A8X6YD37_9ARAC|nr:adducin-related protein C1289.14 [Trichonephila inaurata madagascariensis]